MALSLLAGYSSPESESDSDDDGINVVIHKTASAQSITKNDPSRRAHCLAAQARKRSSGKAMMISTSSVMHPIMKKRKVLRQVGGVESVLTATSLEEKGDSRLVAASIPLPSTVLTMFDKSDQEESTDLPFLHKGRIRSFPHEKNSWASFVYIDVSDLDLDDVRNFLVKELELEPTEDVHLSLSRTVSLRHHWIDPLVTSLTQQLREIDRFTLKLDRLRVYTNDERTRTFVGLEASGGVKQLNRLSQGVDRVLKEYNLPPFYYPPSYHVSLGWCLGDKMTELGKILPGLELKLLDVLEDEEDFGKVFVKTVTCKSGNKFFDFHLK